MKYFVHPQQIKTFRWFIMLFALIIFISLVGINAFVSAKDSDLISWIYIGFSTLAALIFFATGSIVFLYAKSRLIASLLFCFSFALMIAFAVSAGTLHSLILDALGSTSSETALLLLSMIVCLFPRNYLFLWKKGQYSPKTWRYYLSRLLHIYIWALATINLLLIIMQLLFLFQQHKIPIWVDFIGYRYYLIGLLGMLLVVFFCYIRSSDTRERQQLGLFFWGVIIADSPLLLLTVLPNIFHIPAIPGRFSSLTVSLFPLLLGYSILRYQILILDTYIRKIVCSLVGVIFLIVFVYFTIVLYVICFGDKMTIVSMSLVSAITAALSPCIWWLAKIMTEYLFFSEVRLYRRLIEDEPTLIQEEMNLEKAACLITAAAVETFHISQVCLFVLDEEYRCYRLMSVTDTPQRTLIKSLLNAFKLSSAYPLADGLATSLPALERLSQSKRPLLLSEVTREEAPTGLARFLISGREDCLLAPVEAQGKMIGILVLGERPDKQPYAGPDFEIVQLLVTRFSAVLETVRLCAIVSRHYQREKELDLLKEEFITTVSHELRTPLTTVQGYIELLSESIGSDRSSIEEQKEFVERACLGCEDLALLVNNIIQASSISNLQDITLRPVAIHQAVIDVLKIIPKSEKRQVQLTIDPELLVLADTIRLQEVLFCLITNAIDYSPEDSRIEITANADGNQVEIAIRDYGSGIPRQHQSRLFERFMRLERDMNSQIRGSGLGLSTCRKLLEMMGGRIRVESAGISGEGSRFIFSLQLAHKKNRGITDAQVLINGPRRSMAKADEKADSE